MVLRSSPSRLSYNGVSWSGTTNLEQNANKVLSLLPFPPPHTPLLGLPIEVVALYGRACLYYLCRSFIDYNMHVVCLHVPQFHILSDASTAYLADATIR